MDSGHSMGNRISTEPELLLLLLSLIDARSELGAKDN